jgi:hypothetical protein
MWKTILGIIFLAVVGVCGVIGLHALLNDSNMSTGEKIMWFVIIAS